MAREKAAKFATLVRFVGGPSDGVEVIRADAGKPRLQVAVPHAFTVAEYDRGDLRSGVWSYSYVRLTPEREAVLPPTGEPEPLDVHRHVTPQYLARLAETADELAAAEPIDRTGECGNCSRSDLPTILTYWGERWCQDCTDEACRYGGIFDRHGWPSHPEPEPTGDPR